MARRVKRAVNRTWRSASTIRGQLRSRNRVALSQAHVRPPTATRAPTNCNVILSHCKTRHAPEANAHQRQPLDVGLLAAPGLPAAVLAVDVDLAVLMMYFLVADPRMVRDLHSQGVAHLLVRVRDGIGLVGPLVIPGGTSCLENH